MSSFVVLEEGHPHQSDWVKSWDRQGWFLQEAQGKHTNILLVSGGCSHSLAHGPFSHHSSSCYCCLFCFSMTLALLSSSHKSQWDYI